MKWKPEDIIVLILVIILGTVFLFEQITPVFREVNLTESTTKFIQHGQAAMLAIISLYVGNKLGKKE